MRGLMIISILFIVTFSSCIEYTNKSYYSNGNIKMNCKCRGNKVLKCEIYYPDGSYKGYMQYRGDFKSTYTYSKEGYLSGEAHYYKDKLHGQMISYYKNGNKSGLTNYKNGQKHGKAFYYSEIGEVVKEKIFDYGELIEEIIY